MNGEQRAASRVAFFIVNGPIQDGLVVRHKCDNPPCCNPLHLELGTLADNNGDRSARGRSGRVYGEDNPCSKLTEAQVETIRQLKGKRLQREIAAEFGLTQSMISKIWTGRAWNREGSKQRAASKISE